MYPTLDIVISSPPPTHTHTCEISHLHPPSPYTPPIDACITDKFSLYNLKTPNICGRNMYLCFTYSKYHTTLYIVVFGDIRIYLIVGFIRHTTGMTHLKTVNSQQWIFSYEILRYVNPFSSLQVIGCHYRNTFFIIFNFQYSQ